MPFFEETLAPQESLRLRVIEIVADLWNVPLHGRASDEIVEHAQTLIDFIRPHQKTEA